MRSYTTYRRELKDVDRCKCDGVLEGFVKVSVRAGTDELLGATVVGPAAGEMIAELTLCLAHGIGLSKLAGTVHAYPTAAEAVRQCAAAYWQRGALRTPANLRALGMLMQENPPPRRAPAAAAAPPAEP